MTWRAGPNIYWITPLFLESLKKKFSIPTFTYIQQVIIKKHDKLREYEKRIEILLSSKYGPPRVGTGKKPRQKSRATVSLRSLGFLFLLLSCYNSKLFLSVIKTSLWLSSYDACLQLQFEGWRMEVQNPPHRVSLNLNWKKRFWIVLKLGLEGASAFGFFCSAVVPTRMSKRASAFKCSALKLL
jgi:hypothetical protein